MIIAIVVGGIVGWLASIVMKTNEQMGILANIVVGVIGSSLGNWLAPKLGVSPEGGIGKWLVWIGGAMLFILILKGLGFFKGKSA